MPPWTTWISWVEDDQMGEFSDYLVAWIPQSIVPKIEEAVENNACGNAAWLPNLPDR